MSKQQTKAVAAATDVETENSLPSTIEVDGGKVLNVEEMINALSSMSEGENLVRDYFTMEPGDEPIRAFYIGMGSMNSLDRPGEKTDAVKLLTKDGIKINADKVLVSTLRDLPTPTPVQIECIGKTKSGTGKGQYRNFVVQRLS